MKRLLDEKNASMDRMKRKLEEARAAGRGGVAAERDQAARLTDRQELTCLEESHNEQITTWILWILYICRCEMSSGFVPYRSNPGDTCYVMWRAYGSHPAT